MSEIDLQEGKVLLDGEWLSVEDLSAKIQQKMNAGDMKISHLAAALEVLNTALENSHALETTIVIPKDDYEKLKTLGGDDDLACVRKAIMAFIGADAGQNEAPKPAAERSGKKKKTIKCAKCQTAIEIEVDKVPAEIECPECGTVGRLKTQKKE